MELAAIEEATKLLNEFGDSNTKILKTQFPGIIKAETILELLELVEKFRNKIENDQWERSEERRVGKESRSRRPPYH